MTITALSADGVSHDFPDGTDTSVIGGVMKSYAAAHSGNASFGSDLTGGLHDLGTSVAEGVRHAGFEGAAKAVEGITPDAPSGPSPGSQMADNLRSGNYRAALGNLPHAIARAAPSVAPIIAGGIVGGPVGAGVAAGGLAYGPSVQARMEANNRTEPSTSDQVLGGLNAAGQGALGAFLPGGAASRIANPILRGAAKTGVAAEAGAAMDAANQAGTTVGTDKGLKVDPYQVATAGLTQGGLRGAVEGRGLASEGVKAGADQLMARTMPMPDTDTAGSIKRVTDLSKQIQDQRAAAGQPVTAPAAFAAVKDAHIDRLNREVISLRADGVLDKADFNQLNNTIDAAKVGKNTITESQLAHVDGLEIPDATKAYLKENLVDLNTASTQSFLNNETGPFSKAGRVLGQVAGIGGAVLSHDPVAMVGSVLGRGLEGSAGAKVGMLADRMFGTNTPPILLQRIQALRALKAAGIDPSSVTPSQLPAAPPPASAVTGNAPDPIPVNTPIPPARPAPPGGAGLPPLQVNTPADVRQMLATDDMASPPPPPAQRGGMNFVANGLPHMAPEQIVQNLREHEAAGGLGQGEVDRLLQANSVPADAGRRYQALANSPPSMAARAQGLQGAKTYAVDRSHQARINATEYQNTARAYAGMHPEVGDVVLQIAQGAKTPAAKQAIADAYVAQHPEAAGKFPEWLLNHGQRS